MNAVEIEKAMSKLALPFAAGELPFALSKRRAGGARRQSAC